MRSEIRNFVPRKAWLYFFLIVASGCEPSLPSSPNALNPAMVAKIDAAVEQTMKENKIPGLALGVIRNNQIVYTKGFGVTNASTGQAVTQDTVFQLGSLSKMMVGTAIMQLSEQGKIDIDAPVANYLPYFQLADERYREITLRQILSHRSGLPYSADDDEDDAVVYRSAEYDDGSLERHIRNLAKVKLESPPGVRVEYSDLGFEILGDLIAKVSGESFESYVQKHIFSPSSMQHSSFLIHDVPSEKLASPHVLNPEIEVNGFFPYTRQRAPSSHLFSNVEDMARYALVQLNQGQIGNRRVVPINAYQKMWRPEIDTNMPSPWEKKLGLGWFVGEQSGHRLVGHAGGDIGFASDFIVAPDDGVAVIVMVNREYYVEELSTQVIDWMLAN